MTIDASQRHTTLPALCPVELPRMPEFYGMNYVRFDEAITDQQTLKIFFEGERDWISTPLNWRLLIIKYYELGGACDIERSTMCPPTPATCWWRSPKPTSARGW